MPAETLLMASGQPMAGPLVITPQVFGDDRGFFYESWNERRFRQDLIAAGVPASDADVLKFRQDNHSRSSTSEGDDALDVVRCSSYWRWPFIFGVMPVLPAGTALNRQSLSWRITVVGLLRPPRLRWSQRFSAAVAILEINSGRGHRPCRCMVSER